MFFQAAQRSLGSTFYKLAAAAGASAVAYWFRGNAASSEEELTSLSKKEFRDAVRELGFETAPKEEIDAVFALLDPDKSGKLSYEELDKGLRKINQERKKAEEQEKKQQQSFPSLRKPPT